jgi:hypothetical protein
MNALAKWFIETFAIAVKERPPSKRSVAGKMPENTKEVRDRFLSRPDDPKEKRTALHDRMQSGGG